MKNRSGFVLTGGASRRMGRDKALLEWQGTTLVERIAKRVREAAGSVALVGHPERYTALGIPGIADRRPDAGPLGGIEAALAASDADWNLIVACDMPCVTTPFLDSLLTEAERSGADCLVPVTPDGRVQPLCAAYNRRCLEPFTEALDRGIRSAAGALELVRAALRPFENDTWAANVNDPEDLAHHPACPEANGLR